MCTPFGQYVRSLEAVLAKPLPGLAAQLPMSPSGRVDATCESTPDYAREVRKIIDLSTDSLWGARSASLFDTPLGPVEAPCYLPVDRDGVTRRVWGATAMILAEFLSCHEAAVSPA